MSLICRRVSLVKEASDKLSKVEWVFDLFDGAMVLAEYSEQSRLSLRGKYHKNVSYERLRSWASTIRLDQVPVTEAVLAEAKDQYIDLVKREFRVLTRTEDL